jgi:hypothetical protein
MSKKNLHYTAAMNHDFQKNNEEDALVALLDTMEVLGWKFAFSTILSSRRPKWLVGRA